MTILHARLPKLLALLCLGLLLSSCVTMAVESDFEGDGPATHSMTFTIDTSSLGSLGQDVDPTEGLDEAEDAAEREGYRVEQIRDGDIVGMKISIDVEDSSDLGQVLNNLYNAQSTEDTGEPITPFSGTFSEEDGEYRLELTVDGDELVQGAGEDLGEGQAPEDFGFDLATIFDMTYTANMPGDIDEDETNGEILDDGRVQWELPLTGVETLTAVSSADDDDSNLLIWLLIGGIILLGLIGVAAVVFIIFMGRRSTAPATAGPESPEPGPGAPPATGPFGAPPSGSMGATPPPSSGPPTWSQPNNPPDNISSADQPTRPIPPPPDQASNLDAGGEDDRGNQPGRPAF
jgi:hypothetical protein